MQGVWALAFLTKAHRCVFKGAEALLETRIHSLKAIDLYTLTE